MQPLPAHLLGHAARIFLDLAYPGGEAPAKCRPLRDLHAGAAVPAPLLEPPLCQDLCRPKRDQEMHGYAFRLGSEHFPHLKLQVVWHDQLDAWIFSVDTHDYLILPATDPDLHRFHDLQARNRQLKERIEEAWEAAGLMTFKRALQQELGLS
jgi:hypothetical protein